MGGLFCWKPWLLGLRNQTMTSATLTEGQVTLDTCEVGHSAGADVSGLYQPA